jgi:hypothetical protein
MNLDYTKRMKNLFEDFPGNEELLEWYGKNGSNLVHEVNGHFHTPYSFSAFKDMKQVFQMAEKEKVNILGINDFYTTKGYEEFTELSDSYKKFPLYNIEFMGLLKAEQEKGIRVNDPNNPGRIYFCGKGLDFPVIQDGKAIETISHLCNESMVQTREMVEKTSAHLVKINPHLSLDFDNILVKYTKGMLRERHIAKAVRLTVFEQYSTDEERKNAFTTIFNGKEVQSDLSNSTALEDEIRSRLLKVGGPGFVKEDPKAFLEIDEIIKTIIEAGGIPTYPILCDDKNDNFTDYEKDPEELFHQLSSRKIYSVELIPGRNSYSRLKEYACFFHDRKYIVTFGTEHNSPEMIPLKVDTRGGKPLDEELRLISFEGACIMAAHQYLRSKKLTGFINENGSPKTDQLDEFIELGNAVIEYFLQN